MQKRFEFDAMNWGDLNHDSEIDSRKFRPKEHNPFRNGKKIRELFLVSFLKGQGGDAAA